MDIVSYRGPGAPGGVSSGLASAWHKNQGLKNSKWWFIADHSLNVLNGSAAGMAEFVTQLSEETVSGHYHFCNDFLWPTMHDLPQYATYDEDAHSRYRQFNQQFASYVAFENSASRPLFVQDYQLAVLPRLLSIHGLRSMVFWHIPWPKNVASQHREAIAEIARGLLAAEVIGFHTDEYVVNFMKFVDENLIEYTVDFSSGLISPRVSKSAATPIEMAFSQRQTAYVLRPYERAVTRTIHGATRLVVKPLGIDVDRWQELAQTQAIEPVLEKLPQGVANQRFVLSVDRADYTKSVIERLIIVDQFFQKRPEMVGNLSFLQICGRSRAGLPAFDNYWENCRSLCDQINNRWRKDSWQPVQWMEQPLNASELSVLYRRAAAMLVNPVRDGLNLTAKEYVACQDKNPGVLLLSPGAGAWHEIGKYALPADPQQPEQVVASLSQALHMSEFESKSINVLARIKLEKFCLDTWWNYFERSSMKARTVAPAAAASVDELDIKTA